LHDSFDVIVVGAGPAGSSCARRAAELGARVLILEKSDFPRAKPCGAGLTDKTLALMGGEEKHVEHHRFSSAEIAFGGRLSLMIGSSNPLIVMTTRGELDARLAASAEVAGVRIDYERAATALEEGRDGITVAAGTDSLTAPCVVVADGARGVGRRMLGLAPMRLGGGAYVRAFQEQEEPDESASRGVLFDVTAAKRGYGWVFPKRGHLNVGVFSQRPLDAGLTRELGSFLTRRGLDGWRTEGPFAFPIPVGRPRDALGTSRVLFTGDAAGLVNAVTGEGISSAILSGRLAAESLAGGDGRDPAGEYARRVRSEVLPMTDGSRWAGQLVYGIGPTLLDGLAATPVLRSMIGPAWRAASRRRSGLSVEAVLHEDGTGRDT
jgi:geranylgeranyl reductase family protein